MSITKKISDELGYSKSTVSRALNNCGGVDIATKERIIDAALKYGYRRYLSADIGIVMPAVPRCFWKNAQILLMNKLEKVGVEKRVFLYPGRYDVEDALRCVTEAIDCGISVLVAAVPDTKEIREKLEEYSDKLLIILFEEDVEVKNAFYVGENHFESGYKLISTYMDNFKGRNRFVSVCGRESNVVQLRLDGIKKFLAEKDFLLKEMNIPMNKNAGASVIARMLNEIKEETDCVICLDDGLAQVYSGIYKLKMGGKIHCIGFDKGGISEEDIKNKIIKLNCCCDLELQITSTAEYVKKYIEDNMYPDKKYNYIKEKFIMY